MAIEKKHHTLKNRLINTLHMLTTWPGHCLVVYASMFQEHGKVVPYNIGDDLNCYLLEALTGRRVFNKKDVVNIWKRPVYLCIGSVLNARWMRVGGRIVWGAGARNAHDNLRGCLQRITAVRGPLTRKLLLSKGYDCPEVYGDPVLLLPRVYKPRSLQPVSIGLVPHMDNLDSPHIARLLRDYPDLVTLIDVHHYTDWHTVIDQICRCQMIVSSSLHGLVIADAYHVPNVWMQVADSHAEDHFKYLDYFASVGRTVTAPVMVGATTTPSDIQSLATAYEDIQIDLNALVEACPFL